MTDTLISRLEQATEGDRELDDMKHKLWMVASHATGGRLGGLPMEEVCAMSANQISLAVTAFRNRLWNDGKEAGRKEAESKQ